MARDRKLSLIESARLFALVNVSMQDGVQTAQASKFVYQLWRPVHAIQRAGEDLNPATDADPTWMPLLTTPPYPSYAGNMACIGASAARALALYFGTQRHSGHRAVDRAPTAIDYVARAIRGLLADRRAPGREPRVRWHPLSLRHHGEPGSLPEGGRLHLRQLHAPEARLIFSLSSPRLERGVFLARTLSDIYDPGPGSTPLRVRTPGSHCNRGFQSQPSPARRSHGSLQRAKARLELRTGATRKCGSFLLGA